MSGKTRATVLGAARAILWLQLAALLSWGAQPAESFHASSSRRTVSQPRRISNKTAARSASTTSISATTTTTTTTRRRHSLEHNLPDPMFDDFVEFLMEQQTAIIKEIEETIEQSSDAKFGRDTWGCFDETPESNDIHKINNKSGGITRVIQGGSCIEKGACSLTLIVDGILTKERAANIQARQICEGDTDAATTTAASINVQAGDTYSAVALSMVLHSRSPLVPTFRSDVRVFLVTNKDTNESRAWFGASMHFWFALCL